MLPVSGNARGPDVAASSTARPTLGAIAALTLAKLGVHLATLRPHGFFRDELYYLACARHLDWGYVDQPPLSILALRGWTVLFGDSLAAVRVLAALAGAATMLAVGLLARALGGQWLAVLLGGIALLTAGQYLGTAHYYSMNVFDQLFWTVAAYLVVRALEDGAPRRRWIGLGIALGLGLLNKISVLWLGAGLLVGLIATPARAALKTPGPYIAGFIAAATFAPYILWELHHGWPTLEFMRNALAHKYLAQSRLHLLAEAVQLHNPLALPIWLGGLYALVRGRLGTPGRVLGCTFLTVLAIVASQRNAKAEYLSPSFAMLMAAGGVFWERVLGEIGARIRARSLAPALAGVLSLAALAGGLLAAPFALANLPVERFIAYQHALGVKPPATERRELAELPQFYADMHGWAELTDAVTTVYQALDPAERAHASIWVRSGGYGPAAAIDYFGRGRGLPPAICAHNNYWIWGPGTGDGQAVVIVGGRSNWISKQFETFQEVTRFECRYCLPDENHKPIYVGRRLKTPFAELWPEERNFE
jgi:hypothetical protein